MGTHTTWGLCWVLLVMMAAQGTDSRSGQRSLGPTRQRGTAQRRSAVAQARIIAVEDDPDYRAFFREVPKDRFDRAVAASPRPEEREPGNRFSGYYLFQNLRGWDLKDHQSDAGDALQWAVLMREAHDRLRDQIERWGRHRQLPDGSLGGGWGDDVEIGLVWEMIALLRPNLVRKGEHANTINRLKALLHAGPKRK